VADGKLRPMDPSYMRLTGVRASSVRPLNQLRSRWTVIGNTGSTLDAIYHLMYGPGNDRGAPSRQRPTSIHAIIADPRDDEPLGRRHRGIGTRIVASHQCR
jgi:hypothetical protein